MAKDEIELLTAAMHEIRTLRRDNEILYAKVEVMDLFACVLHTKPAQSSRGMAVDVAWQIETRLAQIAAEEKAPAP